MSAQGRINLVSNGEIKTSKKITFIKISCQWIKSVYFGKCSPQFTFVFVYTSNHTPSVHFQPGERGYAGLSFRKRSPCQTTRNITSKPSLPLVRLISCPRSVGLLLRLLALFRSKKDCARKRQVIQSLHRWKNSGTQLWRDTNLFSNASSSKRWKGDICGRSVLLTCADLAKMLHNNRNCLNLIWWMLRICTVSVYVRAYIFVVMHLWAGVLL